MIEKAAVAVGCVLAGVGLALLLRSAAVRPRRQVVPAANPWRETTTVLAPTRGDLDAEVWFKEAAGWRPFGYVVHLIDPDTCTHKGYLVQLERYRGPAYA